METTISADGRMVAALTKASTDQQRLRILNLDDSLPTWKELPPPKYTSSIEFGLTGHQLLLTHSVPAPPPQRMEQLTRWNLDQWQDDAKALYQAEDLAFPKEVTPGKVMVRTREPNPEGKNRHYSSGYYWIWVDENGQAQDIGPKWIPPYSDPNIVGTGWFWFDGQLRTRPEEKQRQELFSYAFPGGVAPSIAHMNLAPNTSSIKCDYQGVRCIRLYIANLGQKNTHYIYQLQATLDGVQWCDLPGISGYMDGLSVTPDGKAAVTAAKIGQTESRKVVVMHFKPKQCEATSIQHFSLEEPTP